MSAGHIVITSSLRFHLTLFVCTCAEEAELRSDFEAEDIYAAGGKVLEISRHMTECPGFLYWKILCVVQMRTGGPQDASVGSLVRDARGKSNAQYAVARLTSAEYALALDAEAGHAGIFDAMAFYTSDVSRYVAYVRRESAARSEDPYSGAGVAEYANRHGISINVYRLLFAFRGLESFYSCHTALLLWLKKDGCYVGSLSLTSGGLNQPNEETKHERSNPLRREYAVGPALYSEGLSKRQVRNWPIPVCSVLDSDPIL